MKLVKDTYRDASTKVNTHKNQAEEFGITRSTILPFLLVNTSRGITKKRVD